jgi:hypothetical protein
VRGYRNALLTSQSYTNLTQCETIDGTLPRAYEATRANVICRCQAAALASIWRLPRLFAA